MSLVESVENIVVSALARQDEWGEWQYGHGGGEKGEPTEPDSSVVTRDIINAIADVLEEVEADKSGPFRNMNAVSDWLRSQANPDSAESD